MPFCLHYNIISNTFLIINLLNQQVSVPHPLCAIGRVKLVRSAISRLTAKSLLGYENMYYLFSI